MVRDFYLTVSATASLVSELCIQAESAAEAQRKFNESDWKAADLVRNSRIENIDGLFVQVIEEAKESIPYE